VRHFCLLLGRRFVVLCDCHGEGGGGKEWGEGEGKGCKGVRGRGAKEWQRSGLRAPGELSI
jgi:hypothetical protein